MNSHYIKLVTTVLVYLSLCSCDIPKDSADSWNSIKQTGNLKVGVASVDNRSDHQVKSQTKELNLLRQFADLNAVKIQFKNDTETNLIEDLKQGRLHIISGKFDKNTIWQDEAASSTTYDGSHVFLLPKGENELLYHLEEYLFKYKKDGQ